VLQLLGGQLPAGQHVLERTAVLVSAAGAVEGRFTVGLPAQGRSIMGRWAAQIITQHIARWAQEDLQSSYALHPSEEE
jgi:hypothetical protein